MFSGTPASEPGVKMTASRASASSAMSAGPSPQSASPFFHCAAASAAAACRSFPSRRAASGSIQGAKDGGVEVLEQQEQVAEIALGVDGEDGHALEQQLLDEGDGEAGLAGAGHADDEAVGHEVGGLQLDPRAQRPALGVEFLADVEALAHAAQYRTRTVGRDRCPLAMTRRRPLACTRAQ